MNPQFFKLFTRKILLKRSNISLRYHKTVIIKPDLIAIILEIKRTPVLSRDHLVHAHPSYLFVEVFVNSRDLLISLAVEVDILGILPGLHLRVDAVYFLLVLLNLLLHFETVDCRRVKKILA